MVELERLIEDFYSLKIREKSGLTFLEIARCPHIENVWSNILAFYLNPNNEHNTYELLLKTVFETAGKKINISDLKNIYVQTEYPTKSGNRIDIIVFSHDFILGIENKVNAGLYNDLEDYAGTLEGLAKFQNIPVVKIVLSKNKNKMTNGFINILYSDLIKNIKKSIGNYTAYSNTKYLIFLLDFIKNIEKNLNSKSMSENLEVVNFFHKNVDKISRLIEYHNKFESDLINKMNGIDKFIKKDNLETVLLAKHKNVQVKGPGFFTWQGSKLVKYNIILQDISLFFQIGIRDYKLVSHFWFSDNENSFLKIRLLDEGIDETTYEYNETIEAISIKVIKQIKTIVATLENEIKLNPNR